VTPQRPPRVDLILPDQQVVQASFHARLQRDNGAWMAQVGVVLWQTTEDGAKPGEYRAWVPFSVLGRRPGEDYSAVPTQHWSAAPPKPAAARAGQWPPPADEWRVQRERRSAGTRIYPTTVHHYECFITGGSEKLTAEQARAALRRPRARACTLCGAERLLEAEDG